MTDGVEVNRIRRADWLAGGVVAALVLLAFFEVAFLGKTFGTSTHTVGVNGHDLPTEYPFEKINDEVRLDPGASAWQFEPWAEVSSQSFARGRLPLWNPYQGAGAPLAANMQSAVFDPGSLLVNLHPTPLTWDLTFLVHFLLAGLAMYVFCRLIRLNPLPSVVGAGTFAISGYFFLYSNNQFVRSYVYLPVLAALVEVVVTSKRLLPVAGLGLAIAANIAVGMPEASLVVLAPTAAFAFYRIFRGPRSSTRGAVLLRLAGAGAFGVAIAAPLLLIFLEYLPVSFHIHEPGRGFAADNWHSVVSWVMPYISGIPRAKVVPGGLTGARNWVGAAALVLAIAAVSTPQQMRRHRGWFFLSVAALTLLKMYGFRAANWIGALPGANRVGFEAFIPPLGAFSLAVLAGIGVQTILARTLRRPPFLTGLVAVILGLAAVLGASPYLFELGLDHVVVPWLGMTIGGVLILGAISVVLIAVSAACFRGPLGAWLVAALTLGELMLLVPRGIYSNRFDPYLEPEWLSPVIETTRRTEGGRVFGLDALLFPNIAGVFSLQDIRTLDGLFVDRYITYLRTFVEPEVESRFVGGAHGQVDEATLANIADNPMFDLLGVRFILTRGTSPGDFTNRVFSSTPGNERLRPATFDIEGEKKSVLFQHASQEVIYPVWEKDPKSVSFSYATDPTVWNEPGADGVTFSLEAILSEGSRVRLWKADYLPGIDPVTPKWRHARIDLSKREPIKGLVLRTDMRRNEHADWAGWADLTINSIVQGGRESTGSFHPVGQMGDIRVLEDEKPMPRAFLVHRVLRVRNLDDAVTFFEQTEPRFPDGAVRVQNFDPSREAIVEARPADLRGLALSQPPSVVEPPSDVRIVSYLPEEVTVEVHASQPGLLVLTDTFYPGWDAEVNDSAVRIFPTDLAFRGVPVGKGRSTVVFRYHPARFRVGLFIAGLALLMMSVMGALRSWRRRREKAIGSKS